MVEYLIERCYDMDRYASNETSIYSPATLKIFLEGWTTSPTGKYPSYPHINTQYEETIQTTIDNFSKGCKSKLTLLMIREIIV